MQLHRGHHNVLQQRHSVAHRALGCYTTHPPVSDYQALEQCKHTDYILVARSPMNPVMFFAAFTASASPLRSFSRGLLMCSCSHTQSNEPFSCGVPSVIAHVYMHASCDHRSGVLCELVLPSKSTPWSVWSSCQRNPFASSCRIWRIGTHTQCVRKRGQ